MEKGEGMYMQTTIEPRFSETDALGHINNTVIPAWLEASRNQLFWMFTPNMSFDDWKLVVVNTNTNFKDEIYFGHDVVIYNWVKKIGNSSLQLYEEIWQNDRLCVDSTVTYVNVDLRTKKTETIPTHLREQLMKYLYNEEGVEN